MRRGLLACVLCLTAMAALAAEHTEDTLATVRQNLSDKKAVLIDVREPGEWKQGHLIDASLVPLSDLKKLAADPQVKAKLEKALPKDRIIYCHCRSGVRVLSAADILGKLGYDIRPLSAGYSDLRDAGFPAIVEEK